MARRFIRRTGMKRRRRRFIGKRRRFGKIYRKFAFRKALKPELKFKVNITNNITAGGSGSTRFTFAVTTDNILNGTAINEKIGRQVNMVKAHVRMFLRNDSANGSLTAPILASALCKVIFWVPRVDSTAAINYMNTLSQMWDQIDFDTVTIMFDRCYSLGPSIMAGPALSNIYGIAAGSEKSEKLIKKNFKFPRKAKFYQASPNTVNIEKDIIYCTVIGGNLAVRADCAAKLYYFDS